MLAVLVSTTKDHCMGRILSAAETEQSGRGLC